MLEILKIIKQFYEEEKKIKQRASGRGAHGSGHPQPDLGPAWLRP